jgi:hypothetical protein
MSARIIRDRISARTFAFARGLVPLIVLLLLFEAAARSSTLVVSWLDQAGVGVVVRELLATILIFVAVNLPLVLAERFWRIGIDISTRISRLTFPCGTAASALTRNPRQAGCLPSAWLVSRRRKACVTTCSRPSGSNRTMAAAGRGHCFVSSAVLAVIAYLASRQVEGRARLRIGLSRK